MSGNPGLLSGINRGSGGPVLVIVETPALTIEIDDVGGGVIYYGFALPASLESAPAWRIMQETSVGADSTFKWADGNKDFDNVWDDRESLSYP